jgi:AcrR family transcriptional regulator
MANGRRARRAPGEVRKLLLDAARASFDERGYARSTTRDIAARAGVAEVLLFRNFGSKAGLFAQAVMVPLVELYRDALAFYNPADDADVEDHTRGFIDRLYALASEHRGLLTTYFATRTFEPEVVAGQEFEAITHVALDDMASETEERLRRLGVDVSEMDVRLAARSVIGMIIAVALFEDWLFPSGRRKPKRRDIVDELTRQSMYGAFNEHAPRGRGRKS